MEDLWNIFCGQSGCARNSSEFCTAQLKSVIHPSSCVNHAFIVSFDLLLLAVLLWSFIWNISSKKLELQSRQRLYSTLQISSAVFNGCLGLVYIGFGVRDFEENLRIDHSISPIHWWSLYFLHGVTWLLIGLTLSLKGESFPKPAFRILSISVFLCAGIFCCIALFAVIVNHERPTVKVVLDVASFLGASLLLLSTYKGYKDEEVGMSGQTNTLYTPLNVEDNASISDTDAAAEVTSFSNARLISKISFCWLNSLMKLGREKTLNEDDIPKLRDIDRAGYCYSQFLSQLNKKKTEEFSSESSMLWTIVACHSREILISGFFALLKILALSAGPLLLKSFIEVAEGKEAFRCESYLLAISLFLAKILESLSQRQWYFRSNLIGLKVRSLLKDRRIPFLVSSNLDNEPPAVPCIDYSDKFNWISNCCIINSDRSNRSLQCSPCQIAA